MNPERQEEIARELNDSLGASSHDQESNVKKIKAALSTLAAGYEAELAEAHGEANGLALRLQAAEDELAAKDLEIRRLNIIKVHDDAGHIRKDKVSQDTKDDPYVHIVALGDWEFLKKELAALKAENEKLRDQFFFQEAALRSPALPTEEELVNALQFCQDIAEEEIPYAKVGTGAEVALRHIIRKSNEALRRAGTGGKGVVAS